LIDLDTIDISNLNRQFLFRLKDVGRSKAETAAEFIMERVPGCHVIPHVGKIQEKDIYFYKQFHIIISGLDNIEARRWMNSIIVNLVEYDEHGDINPDTIIPFIDGGTEGLRGQSRIILPKITPCFECTIESFPPQKAIPLCTIAETPRNAEHCISYVYLLEWERYFPEKILDKDSPEDMQWIYQQSLLRAEKFGISGVTYFKTLGVVKNIIPAVASTNAVIAATCVNEVIKLLTYCSQTVNNYFLYIGNEGCYTPTFNYECNPECLVCGDQSITRMITIPHDITLEEFMDRLRTEPTLQLKKPAIAGEKIMLYIPNPPGLELQLRPNLIKPMNTLIESGEIVTITDSMLPDISISLQVTLS